MSDFMASSRDFILLWPDPEPKVYASNNFFTMQWWSVRTPKTRTGTPLHFQRQMSMFDNMSKVSIPVKKPAKFSRGSARLGNEGSLKYRLSEIPRQANTKGLKNLEALREIFWRKRDRMDGDNIEKQRPKEQTAPTKALKGGSKARNMVLRWALLRALGPDRWHFAAILDTHRSDAFKEAILRAISARGGHGTSLADVGAGSGLMSFIAASNGCMKVTRYEKLRPLAILEGKMAKVNELQGEQSRYGSQKLLSGGVW
jgi:hypothetical protein